MQALSRKLMLVIASLLFAVLLAKAGIANPSVFKTLINKTVAVENLTQQFVSEGLQQRKRMSSLSRPQAIAVDNTSGKLYWTDPGTHKIYSASIDGTGQEIVVKWAPNPRGIAVDKGKIYWTDSGNHQIHRANADGSGNDILVRGLSDPQGIAICNAFGKLYWTDTGTHQIYRANLNGSGRQILIRWSHHPRGIAIDNVGSKLYWIDSGNHQIRRSNLDGSGHEVLVKWVPNPQGVAVDDVGGKIYWTDSGSHQIHRANLDGSGSETLVKWAYHPRGIAVDRVGAKIYWTDSRTRHIYRADLDGSQLEVLIGSLENNQRALADRDKKNINFSDGFIGWKRKVIISPFLNTADSSRESTFGRLSSGEIKLNNPGESRMPDNPNNPSRSPQRILLHKKFHNGAFRAFWPHSCTKYLPQSMLRILS